MKRLIRLLPTPVVSGLRAVRQRFTTSPLPQYMPFLRYRYLRQRSRAILVAELNLGYVSVPKAANRSIKAALADLAGMPYEDPHAAGWHYVSLATLAAQEDVFRFTFVRNPLDRLVSCYAQKIVLYARRLQLPLHFWRYGRLFNPEMSFAEFVEAVASVPDRLADPHFRSQHTFFYDKGTAMVDFIGKFEQLSTDWQKLSQQTGLGPLPHYNRSPHPPYAQMYTPELVQLAAQRYADDIALLGYEAEISDLLAQLASGNQPDPT